MLAISTDFVLDALSLASFSTSEDAKQILERVIDIYEKAKQRKNQVAVDTDMDVFFEIIKELVRTDVNLDRKAERNKIILKVKTSPLAQKDRMIADNVAEMLRIGVEQGLSASKERMLIKRMQNWAIISSTNDKLLEGLQLCRKYSNTDETQNDLILMNMLDKASEITKVQDNIIGTVESLDELDFSSKASMQRSDVKFNSTKKKNVIRLGLQGFNMLLGDNGGLLRGEFMGIGAPSFGGKSLTLMNIARWATVYNKYELNDPGKIPTVLFISLENNVSSNWDSMSRAAYVNANHRPVPEGMTREELIDLNYAYYNKMGNKLIMRKFGEDFGFSDLLKVIAHLELRGHEIVCLVVDYIALLRPEGNDKDNAAKDMERLYQKFLNLAQMKDMAVVTGIQLDATADRLISSGEVCPVKKLSAAALADCKGIKKPLSILIFQVIENTDDGSYLTLYINKHRDNTLPKPSERFMAYKFLGEDIGIMDDLGGEFKGIRDIYADTDKLDDQDKDKKEEDFFSQIQQM